jgi:methylated-DNA-[protein]-cysteine S-methyltransferase
MPRTVVDSPIGPLGLIASDAGLRSVLFDGRRIRQEGRSPVLAEAARQLVAYFDGELAAFDLPLELHGTEFQRRCWLALASIPYGNTVSYGEQARRLGLGSDAARAVGAANGRNPLPIVLPCHRVIGADGSLTGFGGGLHLKRFLLEREGALLPLGWAVPKARASRGEQRKPSSGLEPQTPLPVVRPPRKPGTGQAAG